MSCSWFCLYKGVFCSANTFSLLPTHWIHLAFFCFDMNLRCIFPGQKHLILFLRTSTKIWLNYLKWSLKHDEYPDPRASLGSPFSVLYNAMPHDRIYIRKLQFTPDNPYSMMGSELQKYVKKFIRLYSVYTHARIKDFRRSKVKMGIVMGYTVCQSTINKNLNTGSSITPKPR